MNTFIIVDRPVPTLIGILPEAFHCTMTYDCERNKATVRGKNTDLQLFLSSYIFCLCGTVGVA